jgi:hypothetical protein
MMTGLESPEGRKRYEESLLAAYGLPSIPNDSSGVEGHAAKDQPVIQQPSGLGDQSLPADSRSGRCSEPPISENQASPAVADLNPGIRKLVYFLNNRGFKTTDSGDGVTAKFKCDPGPPYVHIESSPDQLTQQATTLVKIMTECGVPLDAMNEDNSVPTVEAHYNPCTGYAGITLWNVTDNTGDFTNP